jgi:two-component system OmpR family response regulator
LSWDFQVQAHVDLDQEIRRANGSKLDLTPREFQLLEHFLLHPGQVVRRTELLEKVWDMHFDPESNVVDVHVGNLRRKLREAGCDGMLQTTRGVGFQLLDPKHQNA